MNRPQMPNIKESPLFWPARLEKGVLHVLDETLVPEQLHYIEVKNTADAVKVIRDMKTRAFGQFLVVVSTFFVVMEQYKDLSDEALLDKLIETARALNGSRPTFPFSEVTLIIISWAQKAVQEKLNLREYLSKNMNGYLMGIRMRRLERVQKVAALIQNGDSILTHCNVSGELAMAARIAQDEGRVAQFFATETRPYFQGSRLTVWELSEMGVKVTLIADNAVGKVVADKKVNKVIVGSDRNCANGDFANKIGTYQIAILAKEFNIPFYVLTQPSNKIKSGEEIPIEVRDPEELLTFQGQKIVQGDVCGFYPGFDVVPHELVTDTIAINVSERS